MNAQRGPVRSRRFGAVVAVGLVMLIGLVEPARANSGASLAGGNAWIVADFAVQAAQSGTTTNVNAQPASLLNGNVRTAPTVPLAPDAGKSKGFKLRGRGGWVGALLTLGGAVGLDLLLAGDGAPDPAELLPSAPAGEPGYANGGTFVTPAGGGTFTGTLTFPGATYLGGLSNVSVQPVGTFSAGVDWGQLQVVIYCAPIFPDGGGVPVAVGTLGSLPRGLASTSLDGIAGCSGGNGLDHFEIVQQSDGLVIDSWWPEGHLGRPVDGSDPDQQSHTVVNRVECKGPDGVSEWFESVVEFTVGSLREGLVVNIPEVQCPEDKWAASAEQEIRTDVGGTVTTTPLSDGSVSGELADRAAGLNEGTDLGLQLESEGVPCVVGEARCRGWTLDPDKDTRYQCKDNGVVVSLSRCLIYQDAFSPTGKLVGAPGGKEDAPADPEGQQCWPEGWGRVNPLEWVYRPVLCVIKAGFIPTQPLATAQVTDAVQATALGQLSALFTGALGSLNLSGSCGVIAAGTFDALQGHGFAVDTCQEPWTSFAPIRRVIGLAFILGATIVGGYTVTHTIRVRPATVEA